MIPYQKQQKKRKEADVEEVRPRCFLVRHPGAYRFFKGEGVFNGLMVELTTWRQDGLVARLRASGFVVNTLDDQIAALPSLPVTELIGDSGIYPVQKTDHYSHFDSFTLTWVADEVREIGDICGVHLFIGWIIRKRQGRGNARFYRVRQGKDGLKLFGITETEALLAGYAQATLFNHVPLHVIPKENSFYLPDIVFPQPHRKLLHRLGSHTNDGWRVSKRGLPLALRVYDSLGVKIASFPHAQKKRPRKRSDLPQ